MSLSARLPDGIFNSARRPSAREYVQEMREAPTGYSQLAVDDEEEELGTIVDKSYSIVLEKPTFCERWKSGEFTIMPEKSIFMDCWDVIVIMALFITAGVLPYEVALMDDRPAMLVKMDHTVDLLFTLDIVLTFNVAYPVANPLSKDSYERAPIKIAQHYMAFPLSDNLEAGWFWPDLVTVVPWDVASHLLGNGNVHTDHIHGTSHGVRMVRILRLIRMFRLVRVVKLFNRWHAAIGFSFAFFSVCQCLGIVMLALHWLACLWAYVAMPGGVIGKVNWLTARAKMMERDPEDFTHAEVYNLALYFCTMTLTSVGFGDIRPANNEEVTLATAMMIATGFTWAFVLASTVNIVTNMDTYTSRFRDSMDELNLLMRARGLNPSLKWRLRRYMHEAFHVHRQRHQQHTIEWLSQGLQGEIAIESGVDLVCNKIWYLRDVPDEILVEVASSFLAEMFSPHEFIQDKSACRVIRKGTCMIKGRILTRDDVLGEDMILLNKSLRDTACARTLTFMEALALRRTDLYDICDRHPDFSRRVRQAQIKLAMWRGVIYAARQVKIQGSKWEKLWVEFDENKASGVGVGVNLASDGKHQNDLENEILHEIQNIGRRMASIEDRMSLLESWKDGRLPPNPRPIAAGA